MALKWYLVNRRQNLSLSTLEPDLPMDFRVEQVIRNGGCMREASASHFFFHVLVHCTLCESMDYNDPSLEFFKACL